MCVMAGCTECEGGVLQSRVGAVTRGPVCSRRADGGKKGGVSKRGTARNTSLAPCTSGKHHPTVIHGCKYLEHPTAVHGCKYLEHSTATHGCSALNTTDFRHHYVINRIIARCSLWPL